MSRTLVLLCVCLLAGVATVFWLRHTDDAPVQSGSKAGATRDVAPVRGDVDLAQRVAAIEEQLSRSRAEIERLTIQRLN